MKYNKQFVCIAIAVIVIIVIFFSRCSISCGSEDYKRMVLTEDGYMKRSPVKTAFKGDGMTGNPHFDTDPSDELVPLEYGTVDFYKDDRKLMAGRMHEDISECYRYRDFEQTFLPNDERTRADLIHAGDMGIYRAMESMETSRHAKSRAAECVESDLATSGPADFEKTLYHPFYHNDHIGN